LKMRRFIKALKDFNELIVSLMKLSEQIIVKTFQVKDSLLGLLNDPSGDYINRKWNYILETTKKIAYNSCVQYRK